MQRMSMCATTVSKMLTDFYVERSVEVCSCPAIWFTIFDREMYEYVPEKAVYRLDSYCIRVPALNIDAFSVVITKLDSLLNDKILPAYGREVTQRFYSEFIEAFYPEKENMFIVKFSKDVCIIDNARNEGESSADFTLSNRQWAHEQKDCDVKKLLSRPRRRTSSLRDYLNE